MKYRQPETSTCSKLPLAMANISATHLTTISLYIPEAQRVSLVASVVGSVSITRILMSLVMLINIVLRMQQQQHFSCNALQGLTVALMAALL
jgi:hypothetical protein